MVGLLLLTAVASSLIKGVRKQYDFASDRIDDVYDLIELPGVPARCDSTDYP